MPLQVIGEDDPTYDLGFQAPLATPAPAPTGPVTPEVVSAAFRQGNTVVSAVSSLLSNGYYGPEDPSFDPMTLLRGSKYEQGGYLSNFIGVRNENETRAIMDRIDKEEADRELLATSGTYGFISRLAAGALDPTILLPGAVLSRSAAGAYSVGRSALLGAGSFAAQAAASEAVLYNTQLTRPLNEIPQSIGAAALLGGVIGGGAAAVLSSAERQVLTRQIREDLRPTAAPRAQQADAVQPTAPPARAEPFSTQQEELNSQPVLATQQPPPRDEISRVVTPDGTMQFDTRFEIVDAADLKQATGDLQPRDRASRSASDVQIQSIAGRLNPELLAESRQSDRGAPIVDENGTILSGNGRVSAINAAREQKLSTYDQYVDSIRARRGEGAEQLAQDVKNPVLVRRVTGLSDEQKREFVIKSNKDDKLALLPSEQARIDAGLISEDSLAKIDADTERGMLAQTNREFVRSFLSRLSPAEQGDFVDAAGRLHPKGAERLESAVFSKAYGDAQLTAKIVEAEEGGGTRQALLGAAPGWAQLRAIADPRLDITSDLISAVNALGEIRRRKIKLPDYLAQQDAFSQLSPEASTLLKAFYNPAGTRVAAWRETRDFLREYAKAAVDEARVVGRLDGEAKTPISILNDLELRRGRGEDLSGNQASLFGGASPLPTSGGAAAADLREAKISPIGGRSEPALAERLLNRLSPVDRVMGNSPLTSSRRVMADLAEVTRFTTDNERGITTTLNGGPAVDREVKNTIRQVYAQAASELDGLYSKYYFGSENAPSFAKERAFLDTHFGDSKKLTYEAFTEEVGRALRRGDTHEIPEVDAAAKYLRSNVFDPLKEKAIEAGLLSQDVAPQTAETYFTRVYNKQAIEANRPAVADQIARWLDSEQARKADLQKEITELDKSRQEITSQIAKLEASNSKKSADRLTIARRQEGEILNRIEERLKSWSGRSADEALSAIKVRDEALAEREAKAADKGEPPPEGRLKQADKAVRSAVRRIIGSEQNLSPEELRARAQEIISRIVGTPDGRLPYDAPSGGPRYGFKSDGDLRAETRGPLNARQFMIPDALLDSVPVGNGQTVSILENNADQVTKLFLNTLVPDVALSRRFSDVNLTKELKSIEEEAAAQIDRTKAGDEKARLAIAKQRDDDIRDIVGVRDRIRGVYGWSARSKNPDLVRVFDTLKNFNSLVFLGTSGLNSLPDAAGAVYRWGLDKVFSNGFKPWLASLQKDRGAWGELKEEAQSIGLATESFLARHSAALDDINANYRPTSRVERTLHAANEKFQLLNLQAPWTDWVKTVAYATSSNEILRASEAVTMGTATEKQIRNLAASNISEADAGRIWQAYTSSGAAERDGVKIPSISQWQDQRARSVFEAAVSREADIAVITPGQEKPLWMSNPLLSAFGAMRSFTASSTQRVLLANLQQADAQALQGTIFGLGLGMLVVGMNDVLKEGKIREERFQADGLTQWIKEGSNRASLLGWLEEGNSFLSKATGGTADAYRLIGANKPLSRFEQSQAASQLFGVSGQSAQNLIKVLGSLNPDNGWTAASTRAARQLIPLNNLWLTRGALTQVEGGVNRALGIE